MVESNTYVRVFKACSREGKEFMMSLIGSLLSIAAGILILMIPRILNYVVAIYLILFGLVSLF